MKASEAIACLQELITLHGDLELFYNDVEGGDTNISRFISIIIDDYPNFEKLDHPDRFIKVPTNVFMAQ